MSNFSLMSSAARTADQSINASAGADDGIGATLWSMRSAANQEDPAQTTRWQDTGVQCKRVEGLIQTDTICVSLTIAPI
jgi:hypothetical protein